MTRGLLLAALWVAVLTAGCSDDPATTPTAPDVVTTPITVTFTGVVGPNGSISRSFTAQLAGTARASVSGITPATVLGVGMGVPRADGTGCLLTYSTSATNQASAEVAGAVAAGVFCVQVFAPASAAEAVRFSVSIIHP